MEFPRGYAQERNDYRTNESERKAFYYLRQFFRDIYTTIVSGVTLLLFGKSAAAGTDKYQFDDSLQISGEATTPRLDLLLVRGTYEAPTAIQSGDNIGAVSAVGYGTSAYYTGGSVVYTATENWTNSARGTKLGFYTTPTGTTTYEESGHISAGGSWATGKPNLATDATKGFLFVPYTDGLPTGTPETITGRYPIVIGKTGSTKEPYFHNGTAWVALSAGATVSTWTPTITCTTGSFTATSTANCYYAKVGQLVHYQAQITITTVGTATGATTFTLPFAAAANTTVIGNGWNSATVTQVFAGAFGGPSAAYIYQYEGTDNFYTDGTTIYISGTYIAAS